MSISLSISYLTLSLSHSLSVCLSLSLSLSAPLSPSVSISPPPTRIQVGVGTQVNSPPNLTSSPGTVKIAKLVKVLLNLRDFTAQYPRRGETLLYLITHWVNKTPAPGDQPTARVSTKNIAWHKELERCVLLHRLFFSSIE